MNNFVNSLEPRKLKPNTIKIYVSNLNALSVLMTKKDYENPDFLLTCNLTPYFSTISDSKKKIVLATILLSLSPSKKDDAIKKYQKIYDKYKKMLWGLNKSYMMEKSKQTKNIKETENWLDWSVIQKFQRSEKASVKKMGYNQSSTTYFKPRDVEALKRLLVLSLYVLQPPRRLEYGNMHVITHKKYLKLDEEDQTHNNYIVIKNKKSKYFSFGDVKSQMSDDETPQIIKISTALNGIINMYLSLESSSSTSFLHNSRGGDETSNSLSKYLIKIFSNTFNKKIGSNLLRHIYLSEIMKDSVPLQKRKEIAALMNHSIGIQEAVYVKHN